MNYLDDLVYHGWVRELGPQSQHEKRKELYIKTHSRCITQRVLLPGQDLTQDTPHDLARPRLRKIIDNENRFRSRKRTNGLPHLKHQIFLDLLVAFVAFFQGDKGIDSLP